MSDPSKEAQAWASKYYSPFSPNPAAMIGFDAGRASAPPPESVLAAVRNLHESEEGTIYELKIAIADAVLESIKEGR